MANFFKKLFSNELAKISHIAIIMDGNYRYAKSRSLPLILGHKAGVDNIKVVTNAAIEFNIKYLTLYAFSSENWQRPKEEVDDLMILLDRYLDNDISDLVKKGVKLLVSGDLEKLSESSRMKIRDAIEKTKNNNTLVLNIAFSYGARQEIISAVKKIALAVSNNSIKIDEINEELFSKNLYQPDIPDPCLLIRTGFDTRISNFLLWQIAYTELYFVKEFWPEFNRNSLKKAIVNFNKRTRKYGKR